MKRLWFTLFNSGMKIRLYRNGGQQKAQEKQKLKAVVTALHKDDDTFDVMFTEPGFEGKMQGGNHIDDVEIVIKDDAGHPLEWNVKPLDDDYHPRGVISESDSHKKLQVWYFTVTFPSIYSGKEVAELPYMVYSTGGIWEYLRQFPSPQHRKWLPTIWCLKCLLTTVSLIVPYMDFPHWGNAGVMLVIMAAYAKVDHIEYTLDETSAKHLDGGHNQ